MKFFRAYVEITNICGLACSFCPPKLQPNIIMDLKKFRAIVEQLHPFTEEVALHVMGDPMVLINLKDYCTILEEFSMKAMITTSGFYLDVKRREGLFHPSIKQVNISLNSFNKNDVSRSFEDYMQSILAFCDEKLQRQSSFFINLRMWNLDDENSESNFNEIIFQTLEKHFNLEKGFIIREHTLNRYSIRLASKILLHFDQYFEWPKLTNKYVGDGYCHGLKNQIAILASGDVVPCCLDSEGIMKLGNIDETNLGKILSTERAMQIRKGFDVGNAVEELCQHCSYKNRFNEKE